jgi:hypothetical protein
MTIADFKTELARLIRNGSTAGLSRDAMVYELNEAAEDLTTKLMRLGSLSATWNFCENDPVGEVIASHRP